MIERRCKVVKPKGVLYAILFAVLVMIAGMAFYYGLSYVWGEPDTNIGRTFLDTSILCYETVLSLPLFQS